MGQPSTFRWIVTLLVVACMPLCCCDLGPLLDLQPGGPGQRSCCQTAQDESGPQTPGHERGPDGCKCGGDRKLASLDGKSQVTMPPAAPAYSAPEPPAFLPIFAAQPRLRAHRLEPVIRDRTLLRQHCALTI